MLYMLQIHLELSVRQSSRDLWQLHALPEAEAS